MILWHNQASEFTLLGLKASLDVMAIPKPKKPHRHLILKLRVTTGGVLIAVVLTLDQLSIECHSRCRLSVNQVWIKCQPSIIRDVDRVSIEVSVLSRSRVLIDT